MSIWKFYMLKNICINVYLPASRLIYIVVPKNFLGDCCFTSWCDISSLKLTWVSITRGKFPIWFLWNPLKMYFSIIRSMFLLDKNLKFVLSLTFSWRRKKMKSNVFFPNKQSLMQERLQRTIKKTNILGKKSQ